MITQTKKINTWTLMVLSFFALAFTSCDSEDTTELIDTEEFVDSATFQLQQYALSNLERRDGYGCFSLEFPLSVDFDGDIQTFQDTGSLRRAIRAYNRTAGENAARPELVFPVKIRMTIQGTVHIIPSRRVLDGIKTLCNG